jgi:hypothetical protein
VSDQVVAPVRETCAQALGAVLKYMDPVLVHDTLNILLQMQVNSQGACVTEISEHNFIKATLLVLFFLIGTSVSSA